MKLNKAQVEALAAQLGEEIRTAKMPEIEELKDRKQEEIEVRFDEVIQSSEYNDVIEGIDLILGFIENPGHGLPSLFPNLNPLETFHKNIKDAIRTEISIQVAKEIPIKYPPLSYQIEQEIILQTIEVDNLDSLITKIKNKFI